MKETITFVGLDVHKESISVAVAADGLHGEARFFGSLVTSYPSRLNLAPRRRQAFSRVTAILLRPSLA